MSWQERLRDSVTTPEARDLDIVRDALAKFAALVQEATGLLNEERPGFVIPRVGGDATMQLADGRRLEFIGVDGGLGIAVRCENNREVDRLEVFEGALRARDEATTGSVESYFEQQLRLIVGAGGKRR